MSKLITLNTEEFKVKDNEFSTLHHDEFNNLIILESLGLLERIYSLLNELTLLYHYKPNILIYNSTHGGYIPIKCSNIFKNIFIYNKEEIHNTNILANIYKYNVKNISIIDNSILNDNNINLQDIVIINDYEETIDLNLDKSILLCSKKFAETICIKDTWYSLSNTNLMLYIPDNLTKKFINEFHYFIEEDNVLNYDNLIHYTMIVKNAGSSLEEILTQNLQFIDRWTILDTGSTDNTIEIINKVLLGKKKGTLYQEPFIDFKASRNRCLDLAGKNCKFNMMLDDTYIIHGNLRWFLNTVRGDQFSDSFSLIVKSDDVCYASNRIIKSKTDLRYIYRIHEVITPKNNKNVLIPSIHSSIFDYRSDYMEDRTMTRKSYDIEILFQEVKDDPDDPRALYYLGQTYNLLKRYDLALEYYLKRVNHPVEGFFQEKIDACFEAARMSNFRFNKSWDECEKLYLQSFEMDKTRSDALYFIGIHYYLAAQDGKDVVKNNLLAYNYMKQCFELGYPEHCQYSLKPTLHFYFLPKFLAYLCYIHSDYVTGLKCSQLFLEKVKEDNSVQIFKECFNDVEYKTTKSWNSIFSCLSIIPAKINRKLIKTEDNEQPILIFMADGGFSEWTGRDILTKGMGGAETFTVEIARYIQRSGYFRVVVFCRCAKNDFFENVEYRRLDDYFLFIFKNNVHTCIIGRYSEYLPASLEGNIKNMYMIAHDLDFTGNIIHRDHRLRNIFCLSEWHADYLSQIYTTLKDIIVPFGYGIDFDLFKNNTKEKNESYPVFIYSSFPIRGLLPLLEMWSKILVKYPNASLNIHCDVDGNWSNSTRPEEMKKIKVLLNSYKNNKSIIYHGWTNKKDLIKSWINSDICFYPCTYHETFCHTMLEAAASKTLIITTDLAALKNTVGDRGVLLSGDFYNSEFQDEALLEVFKTIKNTELCKKLIEKNFNWVLNMSWENRAEKLLQDFLLQPLINKVKFTSPIQQFENINPLLNYSNMYNWTNDLPSGSIKQFIDILDYIKWKNGGKEINILEIGTFAGTSVIKFLEILPNSKAVVIDKWENYEEHNYGISNSNNQETNMSNIEENNIEKIFYENITAMNMESRLKIFKGNSFDILLSLMTVHKFSFEFIYVDGSHTLLDSYADILLSFNLLKKGGVIGIDDYLYNKENLLESPFKGVNTFIEKYNKEIKVLSKGYRVFIEKL